MGCVASPNLYGTRLNTGDLVRAIVPHGKYAGFHIGRLPVRASGSFNIATANGTIQRASYKYCKVVYKMDGYSYLKGEKWRFHPIP